MNTLMEKIDYRKTDIFIEEYESIVDAMRTEFDSSVFGKKKDDGFLSAVSQIKQSFGDNSVMYSGDNFSTRKLIAWAKKSALHRDPIVGAKKAWLDKMPIDEQTSMLRILATHFGSRKRSSGVNKLLKPKMKVVKTSAIPLAAPKKRGRPSKKPNGTNM